MSLLLVLLSALLCIGLPTTVSAVDATDDYRVIGTDVRKMPYSAACAGGGSGTLINWNAVLTVWHTWSDPAKTVTPGRYISDDTYYAPFGEYSVKESIKIEHANEDWEGFRILILNEPVTSTGGDIASPSWPNDDDDDFDVEPVPVRGTSFDQTVGTISNVRMFHYATGTSELGGPIEAGQLHESKADSLTVKDVVEGGVEGKTSGSWAATMKTGGSSSGGAVLNNSEEILGVLLGHGQNDYAAGPLVDCEAVSAIYDVLMENLPSSDTDLSEKNSLCYDTGSCLIYVCQSA